MRYCTNCGHQLGVGRYCTNCGHPVDSPTDTVERPRVTAPAEDLLPPAPTWNPAPPARYPLYADDDAGPGTDDGVPARHRASRPWAVWAAIGVALVLVALLGIAMLSSGGDDPAAPAAEDASAGADLEQQESPAPEDDPSPTAEVPVGSVTADASVTVPAIAAPGRTVDGEPVDYAAENMLDGVPETAWRMPGDGTGSEIAITLAEQTRLTSVGLINGYAKVDGGRDWYRGNRRIQQVEWVFDDGTVVPQTLEDTTGVQSIDVDATTTTIALRLVAVSAPGTGRDARDFTAISDLVLVSGT